MEYAIILSLKSIAKYLLAVTARLGSDIIARTTTAAVKADRKVICLDMIVVSLTLSIIVANKIIVRPLVVPNLTET